MAISNDARASLKYAKNTAEGFFGRKVSKVSVLELYLYFIVFGILANFITNYLGMVYTKVRHSNMLSDPTSTSEVVKY